MAIKTHIFLSCVWVPSPSDQMAGLFLLRYAQSLYISGYDPVILGVEGGNETEELLQYEQDFIPIRIQTFKKGRIKRYKAWSQVFEKATEEFGAPKLIWHHVFDYNSLVVQSIATKMEIKMYVTEHWSRWFPESKTKFRFLELYYIKRNMPKLAGVSAVSQILANHIEKQTQIEIPYITPVPLAEEIAHQKQQYSIELKNYLVHISCFDDASKRITKLIEEFLRWNSDTKLLLIGNGKDFSSIYQAYSKEERILFTGEIVDKQQLIAYIQNADALVQSSLYETYSMVISEALITGCPVISTDVGVWHSIKHPLLGYTLPKNFSKSDLVKGIQKTLQLDRQVIQNQAQNIFLRDENNIEMLSFLWLH